MGYLRISRYEWVRMTEYNYYLLLIGNKSKDLDEARKNRKTWYLMIKSFADPKTFKMSESQFMPLEGDISKREKPSQESIHNSINRFKNFKKNK